MAFGMLGTFVTRCFAARLLVDEPKIWTSKSIIFAIRAKIREMKSLHFYTDQICLCQLLEGVRVCNFVGGAPDLSANPPRQAICECHCLRALFSCSVIERLMCITGSSVCGILDTPYAAHVTV